VRIAGLGNLGIRETCMMGFGDGVCDWGYGKEEFEGFAVWGWG
jgi:hypothetical protein